METYEKNELRKEITDEVKDDLTRFAGKKIAERVVLALAIAAVEIIFWMAIIALVARLLDGFMGFLLAMVFCFLRYTQMNMIKEFTND